MKLGLVLSVFTPDPAKPMASAGRAAAAGYDAVFASDHLFPPGAPDRPSLEPYTLLAAIGAANPGLGVGVLVTRAGFRPVGMLAKQAAALDQVTGAQLQNGRIGRTDPSWRWCILRRLGSVPLRVRLGSRRSLSVVPWKVIAR